MDVVKLIRDPAEFPDSHEATVDAAEADAWREQGWIDAPAEAAPEEKPARGGKKPAEAAE